ncbi:FAD-dependent monooxygenase [Leifsonia shinshuensis]|uniref:FAD-dependent oxidoreductase n=1 Tax=Leifsonia shinshuensis TaxID=150026 RepID=UPI001F504948|nr:NAD(P)/FAD-dependent oxidoreductase [Leifsonia shinshuensis]MCI0156481.1 FAD-dependent monooxygenase [Leifsonia shinshuensis]
MEHQTEVRGQGSARHAEIAGAGFAGLTAAIALARRGWSVRVHEKGLELREQGAGIVLWNNTLRILDAFGLTEEIERGSMRPPFYETRMQNRIVSDEDVPGIPWRTMTRPFLHSVLSSAAIREGVEIVTGSEVVEARDAGTLRLANGSEVSGDLVIGADGVGSAVRDSLDIRYERHQARDGITRFLVPRCKEELQAIEPDTEWDNVIDFWNLEPRVLRVLYTPANDRELYIALMAPADDAEGSAVPTINLDVWTSIHPQLTPVLKKAAGIEGKYFRYQTNRLEQWTRGRVALVGDAAHAMAPALAQGGGCAMMNAYTVAEAASAASTGDIPDALVEWERIERPYTDRCQTRSQRYADTRGMSKGGQFVGENNETALYDPTDPRRHDDVVAR